jgi:hypothetical protein
MAAACILCAAGDWMHTKLQTLQGKPLILRYFRLSSSRSSAEICTENEPTGHGNWQLSDKIMAAYAEIWSAHCFVNVFQFISVIPRYAYLNLGATLQPLLARTHCDTGQRSELYRGTTADCCETWQDTHMFTVRLSRVPMGRQVWGRLEGWINGRFPEKVTSGKTLK